MPPVPPAPTPGGLVIAPVEFTDPRVQRLVEEVQAHYVLVYGSPDDSPVDPSEFQPPRGIFAIGSQDGSALAMAGWRRRPDLAKAFDGAEVAEIKRMYVAPAGRRKGYARQLLTFLEDTARQAGVDILVLETGTMQPEAIALYEAGGYEATIRFGRYADSELSRYFGRRLGPRL